MISKIKKPVSILLVFMMIVSLFAIVPLSASAAYWYSDLARGTLIQPEDTFSFDEIGSFKFADYNDPTIIHEVKGSDFSYNQATLSVTDGYYSFGSTKLMPTSVSPGGLLIADYDSTTKMATFGVQNITHSFDETTGTLTIGGSGVVPPNYAFTGSDVYGVVFTQSNLVKHLIIDATDMIAIKQDAFMAYTGGCVLEDVEINSTSSTPLIIEENAVFYESDNTVTITVNAVKLATVTNSPVNNYGSPVNLIYNVEQPITFNKNALTEPSSDLTVTFPTGCKIFIPGGLQFTDSQLQEEYDREAEYGYEEYFWRNHSDLVEGTDYVLGDARYEELTPLNASLVVGDSNTALFSAYTITDESVNGTVTASVNGTDVTEASADADVLLTVAPDNGYQFKSISATYPKNKVEEFSDLVAMMGDAVFSAADYADHPEYTCKVNDGKFVVYDGDTSVAELSEANMTNAELGGTYFSAQCGGLEWNLYFSDGIITDIYVYDSDYNYIFSSADGSKSTGTLLPVVVNLTTVTEGSQYSLTMPKMPVTVTAEFEEAPAPETFKVYVKKLNNETYTIENLTGDTTVAQLKEIIADQIDIPVTAQQRLVFAGKTIEDAKTLAEYNIQKESTIHLIIRGYTVTWLNYDNSELGTTTVQYGSTPTYDGETPTKASDQYYDYTFSGWSDGSNTYAADALPAVTGDVTYTAQFDKMTFSSYIHVGDVIDKGVTIKFLCNYYTSRQVYSPLSLEIYLDSVNEGDEPIKRVVTTEESQTEPDRYYTTTQKCVVSSYDFTPRPTSHVLYLKSLYTVTWKDEDGTVLKTEDVAKGDTPSYGTDPTKAEDENYTYTFAGWSPEVVAATADATYTATYTATAKPKDLFPQHSITLGGNIGVNFYINSAAANFASASEATVKFTWDGGGEDRTKEVNLKELTTDADGYYKATVDVVAAQMAHKIHAEVYLNGKKLEQTDDYSVQDYAETVFTNPEKYDSEKPEQLRALVKALLNYGAMAQTVFATSLKEHPALANTVVGDNGYEGVTADQIEAAIKGESADLNAVATQLGAKYYTNSLIYLSKNTLRIYFTPTSYPGEIPNAGAYDGNLSGYYYYVDHANIPAAELDEQKELTVGDYTFTYTALDYAKAVVESTKMEPKQQNLAKALYLYNQKANAYFDAAPAPVENIVDLSALTGDYEAQNNDVLTGVLSGDKKISIADGATVTLKDANITCLSSSAQYAGITPLGDAKIVLDGTNTVKGGYEDYPGVFVPVGKTLTIDGTGSLNASSNGYGCGIGGGFNIAAGNIVINGGTIIATGGELAAGIGSGRKSSCGNITITGGTVTATGGKYAAGIGSGAVAGASCGNITIANTVTSVTATKGGSAPNSIGAGYSGTCGTVTIEDGANVIQN